MDKNPFKSISFILKSLKTIFHFSKRLAMIYNDRSVLENHHLSVAFRLLQNPDIDILMGLTPEEFKVSLK